MSDAQPRSQGLGRALIATGLGLALVCGLLALASAAKPAHAAPTPPRTPATPHLLLTTIVTTDSVQRAIDNASPGDTVVVSDALVYTEPITIWKPITLTGASLASTIVYSAGDAIINVITDNVLITNLTLRGGASKPAASGVLIVDAAKVTVSGLTVNRLDYGVQVSGSSTSVDGITITDNIIVNTIVSPTLDAGLYGIRFVAKGVPGAIQATIQNNQIAGFGWGAFGAPIKAQGLAPTLITDNVLTLTTTSLQDGAIDIDQAGPTLIRGNVLATSIAPPLAIHIHGSATPTVTQNAIGPGFLTGILVGGTAQPLITDSLLSSLRVGVSVVETATATVRGSLIIYNFDDGISFGPKTAGRLVDNLIQNNRGDGVFLNDSARLLEMAGNTICDHPRFGLSNDSNLGQWAAGNWWGHNPPLFQSTTPPADYSNVVTTTPEISMALSIQPAVIPLNGAAAVTLAMHDGLISYTVRDGTPINFSADAGILNPAAATTLNGLAATTYTSTTPGTHVITAVDSCGGLVTATLNVVEPVLTATKAANPPPGSAVRPGQLITYTVTISNVGAYTATNVVFSDTLPNFTQLAFARIDTGTIALTNPISATFAPIRPGGVMSVTFGVRVTLPLTNGTLITNIGSVSYFSGLTGVLTTSNVVTHIVRSSPRLSITKAAQPPHGSVVRPGDLITYTLRISNTGDANATGLVIRDALPANTDLVGYNPVPNGTSPALRWEIPFLAAPSGTTTVRFTVRVTRPLANGTIIGNTGQVTATQVPTITYSNLVTHLVQSAPLLSISKEADPPHGSLVEPGQLITYTLYVTNTGDDLASGVVVTDIVPVYTDYAFGNATAGTVVEAGGLVTWNIGTLSVDAPVSATFGVTVTSPLTSGLIISNLAQVRATQVPTPTQSNLVTHTVIATPLLRVIKENNPPYEVVPGHPLHYELTVRNDGNGNATNVVITDTLPSVVNYLGTLPAGTPASLVGSTWTLNIPSLLGGGQEVTATIVLTVSTPLTNGLVFTNVAWFISDQTPISTSNVVTNVVASQPELLIAKSAIPPDGSTVQPGDTITYIITATNQGTENAPNLLITDTLPAFTNYVQGSASIAGGTNSSANFIPPDTVVGHADRLDVDDVITLTYAITVTAPLTDGTIIPNIALVASDRTPVQNTNLVTHIVQSRVALTYTKTAQPPPGPITPGDTITYTITLTNVGTANATGLVLTDTLPTYTYLIPGSQQSSGSSSLSGRTLTFAGDVPGLGGVFTATFAVTVTNPLTNGTLIVNQASFSTVQTPVVSQTNPVTHIVASAPDLLITKAAQPPSGSTVQPGDWITYTLTLSNIGTANATGVRITDTLDANLNFVDVSPSTGVSGPNPLVFDVGSLPGNGGLISYTIRVTVTTPLTRGTLIVNAAQVTASEVPTLTTSNQVTHTVVSTPELTVFKSSAPPSGSFIDPGYPILYFVTVTNSGNGPATNLTITDTLPISTTYVGYWFDPETTPGTVSGPDPVVATIPSLPSGSYVTFGFAVTVTNSAPAGLVIPNLAQVDSNETVVTTTNVVTHIVRGRPALLAAKTAQPPPGPVTPGDTITYTITLTNTGTANATGVVVTDTLPAYTHLIPGSPRSSGSIFHDSGTLAFIGDVPSAGGVFTATFAVTVTNPLTNGTLIVNRAYFTSAQTGVLSQTNPVTHIVTSAPDLLIAKAAQPPSGSTVQPGDWITYTLTLSNIGTANATGVRITDTLDANLNFVDVSPSTGVSGPNPLVFDVGSLPGNGGLISYTIRVTVTTPLTRGTLIVNAAQVMASEVPTLTTSNQVTHTVVSTPSLTVRKWAAPPSGAIVDPGDVILYFIYVGNTGNGPATNVTITDTLPISTVFVGAGFDPPVPTYTIRGPDPVVATIPSLPSGGWVTFGFAVTVTNSAPAGLVIPNLAQVDSDETVVTTTNVVTHIVRGTPVLAIAKTAVPAPGSPVLPGSAITYTVTVTNRGNVTATNVVISDTLDPNVTLVASATTPVVPVFGTNPVTATWPSLGVNQSASLILRVLINSPLANGTLITNLASADSDQTAVVASPPVTHPVVSFPILSLTKSANPPDGTPVQAGETITYTLTVSNTGFDVASGLVLTDTLPVGVTYVPGSASVSPGFSIAATPPPALVVTGTLPAGQVMTASFRVTVCSVPCGTLLVNTAAVTAAGFGPLFDTTTHPVWAPGLSITKSATPPSGSIVEPGDRITYTLSVFNSGSPASNLVIADMLDLANLGLVTSSTTRGTLSGPNPLHVTGFDLGTGERMTVTLGVTVTGRVSSTLIANQASVTSIQTPLPRSSQVVTHVISSSIVSRIRVFLPIILKNEPPEVPPPASPVPGEDSHVADLAVDPQSHHVYVASPRDDRVHFIRVGPGDTYLHDYPSDILAGHAPLGLGVFPIGGPHSRTFVAHPYDWDTGLRYFYPNPAALIEPEHGYVGSAPIKVAVNPAINRAYVSNYLDNLAVVNAATNTRIGWVKQKNYQGAWGIDVSRNTNRVYLATRDTGELAAFDGNADRLLQDGYIPTHFKPPEPCSLFTVAVNEGTHHIFVPCPALRKVFVHEESELQILAEEELGTLELREDGWVRVMAPGDTNWLPALSLPASVSDFAGVWGIAVDETRNRVYITDPVNNLLIVIQDGGTPFVQSVLSNASHPNAQFSTPQGVDVDQPRGRVFVANAGNDLVTVLGAAAPFPVIATVDLGGP